MLEAVQKMLVDDLIEKFDVIPAHISEQIRTIRNTDGSERNPVPGIEMPGYRGIRSCAGQSYEITTRLVDAVCGVRGIMNRDIDFSRIVSTDEEFIAGMVRTEGNIIILLDIRFIG